MTVTDTGPFTIVPEWLLDSDVSDRAVRLYGILGRYADREGKAHPSRHTLAKRLRCSTNTVDRAVKDLIAHGALTVIPRFDEGGDRTSNDYRLHRVQLGGLTNGATPGHTDGATGGPTDGEENESQVEREPTERDLAPVAREYDPLKGTKIDGRNLPWDALAQETGADETVEKGQLARALKLIRSYVVSAHAEQAFADERGEHLIAAQIRARARLYRDRWPNVELTPTALAKNWSRVVTAQPGRDLDTALEAAQRGIDSARRSA